MWNAIRNSKPFLLIWTAWSYTSYAFWLCFFYPIMLVFFNIKNEKVNKWAHRLPNWMCACSIFTMGIRVKYYNSELVDLDKQYIYICNHTSFLDILSSHATIPAYKKYLGKAEVRKWPVMGFIIRKLYIMVDRSNPESGKKSFIQMVRAIKSGVSLFIYPEGRRTTKEERPLKEFHDGAFQLAIRTNTPIAILTNLNADELIPLGKVEVKPGTLHSVWSEPVETKDLTLDDLESLKQQCYEEMKRVLTEHPAKKA